MTTNIGVARDWADNFEQGKTVASSNGNMSHMGPVLFSYRTPIGNAVWSKHQSAPVHLVTSEGYGVTTEGKHKHAAHRAARYKAFSVPFLLIGAGYPAGRSVAQAIVNRTMATAADQHKGNLAHYRKRIAAEVERLGKARVYTSTEGLKRLQDEEHAYRTAFGLWAGEYQADALSNAMEA